MHFELLPASTLSASPVDADDELLALAAAGRAVAYVREPAPALVMPRSYRQFPALAAAADASAAEGWPAFLRRSGGGLVPQGPGTLTVALAYPLHATLGDGAETVYAHLCALLGRALAQLGIPARAQAVQGSFCDGRYNLAFTGYGAPRKMAGTAQYWQHRPHGDAADHRVLAHAVLLVDADVVGLNARANAFEARLASGRRYRADRLVDVAGAARELERPAPPEGWLAATALALQSAIAAATVPPAMPSHAAR